MNIRHENHDIPQAWHLGRDKPKKESAKIISGEAWLKMSSPSLKIAKLASRSNTVEDFQKDNWLPGSYNHLGLNCPLTPLSLNRDKKTVWSTKNKDVRPFLLARGVQHITTAVSHPESNRVERVNRIIKRMISMFINENDRKWGENLSKFQLAYNNVSHSSSIASPFFLNHGREAVFMHIIKFPENVDNSTIKDSIYGWTVPISKIDEFLYKVE